MLYKLKMNVDGPEDIEPLAFLDFADLGKLEKNLEELLAAHLLDILFEDAALMPIFQERAMQAEADLYALDRSGHLVIFELKRGFAGSDAVLQVLRYAQDAGRWTFNTLEEKYRKYCKNQAVSLTAAHRDAFNLERELQPSEFNTRQQFIIVGNAANDSLISAVDYWKQQGLLIDFLPYRVYSIGSQYYFEFFALPYDCHINPASIKGVIFDTNRSFNEDSIWDMIEKNKVAAYGDAKHVVDYLNPKDIVFFSHKWVGIIGAAEVVGPAKDEGSEERYRDIKFLTCVPSKDKGILKFMTFSQVTNITGKNFFWAKTIKVPYLTRDEAHNLLLEIRKVLK